MTYSRIVDLQTQLSQEREQRDKLLSTNVDLEWQLAAAERQRDKLLAILERVIHLIDDAAVNGYITVPTVPLERWHGPIADARDVLAAAAMARARSGGSGQAGEQEG